jgi:MtN3 and saliva related transmembrane protein
MSDVTEVVGACAAVLTTLSFLPQVSKTWSTGSADDFSWTWLIGFALGLFLWLVYGIALGSLPLVGANGLTLTLVLLIGFIKLRGSNGAR